MNDKTVKPVIWVGDSRKQVRNFPEEVRRDIGVSLFDVQKGDTPSNAKPFKGVGGGVLEIVTRFDSNSFRTVYTVRIRKQVYVLHAFQKKSPKGIKTAQKDSNVIKSRYKQILEIEKGTGS